YRIHAFMDELGALHDMGADGARGIEAHRILDYARQIKKTPIVVEDAVGFYTSRTIGTHIMEGAQLIHEGVDPVRVEALAKGLMYPVGPLTMLDEVSLALSKDIYKTQLAMGLVKAEDNPTPDATALIESMVDEHDRPGKKAGRGFYDYGKATKKMWPGMSKWKKDVDIPDQDIEDRLLFRPIIESLKCLEEGVLRNVPDGNIGSIMGIGAPPWTGGYLQYVNTYGLDRFVARCTELAGKYGARFEAPDIAKKHAAEAKPFV
ncbi:MAG: 3-hydroxyacyl-CoA dehydrogenase family protein, partial [Myxococcota bacterium]